ncbi:MAG: leucine-rich repeat domain-containing protein [Oscillospiraceae bacterium]|nr:leucine-rich repeat domain-containing protein [Oscillospiraceae bacterium]
MKNLLFKFLAGVLAVCLPFAALAIAGFSAEPQFGETFLGALADKYKRLEIIGKPKIMVVGGSSTAFGLDSELLWEELDMPVVNFGLYATLGTKLMLDLSRAHIKNGDVVVVAPELDSQTLSLYFNAESAWQAFDSDTKMLGQAAFSNYGALAGNFWDYSASKLRYKRAGGLMPEGVYSRASFNVDGDIIYPRPNNIMLLGYDVGHPINLDPQIVGEDFVDYLNDYIKYAKGKGALVYFDFPPMNRLGVAQYGDDEAIYEFYLYLANALDCEVIGNINSYILDERYFYDSNYHLNDSGVPIRTALLAEDIKRALGIDSPVSIVLSAPPELPIGESPTAGSEANAEYFLYEPYASGLLVTGVQDAAKGLFELTVPRSFEGKAVLAIGEGAFSGCGSLKKITIEDNIAQFFDRAFSGCGSLEAIVLNMTNANSVSVGEDLLGGANRACRIYLSREAFGNFATDYFWGRYAAYMDIAG